MIRKLLYILPLLFLFAFPVQAQEQPDSVTVSFEALQNLQKAHKELKAKVAIQDSIIAEQEREIKLWENRAKQDSIIRDLTEERAQVLRERMELRDEKIQQLKRENFWLRIRSYLFTAGGVLIGIVIGGA